MVLKGTNLKIDEVDQPESNGQHERMVNVDQVREPRRSSLHQRHHENWAS